MLAMSYIKNYKNFKIVMLKILNRHCKFDHLFHNKYLIQKDARLVINAFILNIKIFWFIMKKSF